MEIKKLGDEAFEIVFEDQRVVVDKDALERLHAKIGDVLDPGAEEGRTERYLSLLDQLQGANDSGIQALLSSATHNDILVLLHSSEDNSELQKKLYSNMSENSVKIYVEDLLFQFREGGPGFRFDEAMSRLIRTAEKLADEGTLDIKTSGG